jgi:hypothetical protein
MRELSDGKILRNTERKKKETAERRKEQGRK